MTPLAPRNSTERMLFAMLGDVSEDVRFVAEIRELQPSVYVDTFRSPSPADPAVPISSDQIPNGEERARGVRWASDFHDCDGFRHMTVHDSHHDLIAELAVRAERANPQFEQMLKDWLDREDPQHAEGALRLA